MKKSAKLFTILLTFVMVFTLATPVQAEAATMKLNKTKVTLNVKKKCQLKVKGTKKKITWKSSNKKVATVSKKGVVTAKKAGKTTVTAKVGKKVLKCKVTVKAVKKPAVKNKPKSSETACKHNWKKVYVEKVVPSKIYCACGLTFDTVDEQTAHAAEAYWNGDTQSHSSSSNGIKESVYDHMECTKCGATKK